jgi:hypothetical protein
MVKLHIITASKVPYLADRVFVSQTASKELNQMSI